MWGKILQAILQLAGSSKINFMAVLQWFFTHSENVQKAIADLNAGADWTTVVADLFKQLQGFASSKRGAKMDDDYCKAFCIGMGNALVEYHNGDVKNAFKHTADALIAVASDCGVPDDPCEPCSENELKALAQA